MQTFQEFAASNGVLIDSVIHGKIVRCPTVSKPSKKNGAYYCGDGFYWVQDWTQHSEPVFLFDKKEPTDSEKLEFEHKITKSREEYARNRAKTQQEAASKARWILGQCELTEHKYIQRKGFKEHPVNVWQKDDQQLLIVPMYHKNAICGCQIISEDGEKKFLSGQRTSGAHFKIGDGKLNIWCEGFATGMAIKKAIDTVKINCAVNVCFSAGNMKKMANNGIVVADNDISLCGENIAKEIGLPYFIPKQQGWDFCDLLQSNGLLRTSQELRKFLMSVK